MKKEEIQTKLEDVIMCKNTNFECIKTTIKIFIFILLLNLLATVLGIEYSPFYWLSNFSYESLPLVQNDVITNSVTDKWAIRGQIGDIMSGHFSALAFLAVALSIVYQIEANKQMRESIEKQENALKQNEIAIQQTKKSIEQQTLANLEQAKSTLQQAKSTLQQAKAIELQAESILQQNEALKLQSISLEAQIKELQEARIESSKQTEEFFINNMNIKLDRYYKILDKNLEIVNDKLLKEYTRTLEVLKQHPNDTIWLDKRMEESNTIQMLILTLNFIYIEISNLKDKYPLSYNTYIEELRIRLNTNMVIYTIYKLFENADTCMAFKLYNIK